MRVLVILLSVIVPYVSFAQTACNCCSADQTAFDFWVGEWQVTDANGKEAGFNSIVKEESGCVVKENWTSAKSGFTGTSYNFYNQKSGQWEQLWIDNTGNHLKLKGNKVGDQMILSSDEFEHTDGKYYVNRITWTANENGTVRQLWEVLQDGKVVNTVFDGTYSPKK